MKKLLIVFCWLGMVSLSLMAQQTALFELPLYFVDSLGNKDTLIVGYDKSASYYDVNEEFGEVVLNESFDSVFEVRAFKSFNYDSQNKYYSKKIINLSEIFVNEMGDSCHSSSGTIIVFNAKYLPVKMYYDRDIINELCAPEATILWQTFEAFLLGVELAFLPETDYQCVFSSDTLILDPRVMEERNEELMVFSLLDEITIEGGEKKQVQGYEIVFRAYGTIHTFSPTYPNGTTWIPCDSVDYVDVGLEEWTEYSLPSNCSLYPNPVSNMIYLKNSANNALYLQLYDYSGKPVIEEQLTHQGLQADYLPSGLYVYRIMDKEKNVFGSGKLQKW